MFSLCRRKCSLLYHPSLHILEMLVGPKSLYVTSFHILYKLQFSHIIRFCAGGCALHRT